MAERFLSVKDVCGRVCLSSTQVYRRINAGTFPRTVRLGQNKAVFLESQIDAWMLAQVEAAPSSGPEGRERSQRALAVRHSKQVRS